MNQLKLTLESTVIKSKFKWFDVYVSISRVSVYRTKNLYKITIKEYGNEVIVNKSNNQKGLN